MISRRSFLAAGLVGAAALAAAAWLRGPHAPPSLVPRRALDADGEAIMTAIVPVLLAGALPAAGEDRRSAIAETIAGVDRAIAGLPAAARKELAQLFALLALPPTRLALAHLSTPWIEAYETDVRAFVDGLRDSRWTLLRAAYDALHQLVFAAWYGNERSWAAIGYPGPPALSGSAL
jgi:hypothetical protein